MLIIITLLSLIALFYFRSLVKQLRAICGNDLVYEINLKTQKLKLLFGKPSEGVNLIIDESRGGLLKEDLDNLRNFMATVINKENGELRINVTLQENNYWYSLRATLISYNKSIIVVKDITEAVDTELTLRTKAERDLLTGLYRRPTFNEQLDSIICGRRKADTGPHALLAFDIDNFKKINDGFGHITGDKVLYDLAKSMKEIFRHTDILCRAGGDEFFVFMPNTDLFAVRSKAEQIRKAFDRSYTQDGSSIRVSLSIGIALFPKDGHSFKKLYESADIALYSVKRGTKNAFAFFENCPAEPRDPTEGAL